MRLCKYLISYQNLNLFVYSKYINMVQNFLFYSLFYNILLSLFISVLKLLKAGFASVLILTSPLYSLSTLLLSDSKVFEAQLVLSLSSPGTGHFSRESWFWLLKHSLQKPRIKLLGLLLLAVTLGFL